MRNFCNFVVAILHVPFVLLIPTRIAYFRIVVGAIGVAHLFAALLALPQFAAAIFVVVAGGLAAGWTFVVNSHISLICFGSATIPAVSGCGFFVHSLNLSGLPAVGLIPVVATINDHASNEVAKPFT